MDVTAVDFRQALTDDITWASFDRILLDGRDDSFDPHREGHVIDRFLGPRVARRITVAAPDPKPVIILVSLHVRENEWFALRCRQSGVDYTYDLGDLPDEPAWISAVEDPGSLLNRSRPERWDWNRRHTDIVGAIEDAETSPATGNILFGEPAAPYDQRALRERLSVRLRLRVPAGADRAKNASARVLRPILWDALGLSARDSGEPHV